LADDAHWCVFLSERFQVAHVLICPALSYSRLESGCALRGPFFPVGDLGRFQFGSTISSFLNYAWFA
jgi:hypothetical protein